ncbi:MAG: hypothetical protein JWO67_2219 [Streptosporangiaceae bacterium]|nr:hypothetical protein [Streptosporangiaceae bacterium]
MILSRICTATYGLPLGGDEVPAAPAYTDPLPLLKRRIEAALATVRGARAAMEHCPSIENGQNVEAAERHLDGLLADARLPRERGTT